MLYGKLALPPVRYGATVKSVDESAAKKVPGFVKAVVVEDKTATTSGWVVAVATYLRGSEEGRGGAQDRLGQGPVCQRVRPVDHRRVAPSAEGRQGRLPLRQGRRFSRGDGKGRQGHRGRISDQPQHPCAARADECPRHAEGRGLAHLYRQSVLHPHDHHRVRGGRYRSQEHRDPPALPGRRLRAPAGVGHGRSRRSRRPRLSASR